MAAMKRGNFYPKGVTNTDGGIQFVWKIEKPAKQVEIGVFAGEKEVTRLSVLEGCRQGKLYCAVLEQLPKGADGYRYYADGEIVEDRYARGVIGLCSYGKEKGELRYRLPGKAYDWEDDLPLGHPYSETVIYGMHVRGFTKHTSSGVKKKGTFAGIREKIPYLKDLGITAVELMPAYEFDEFEKTESRYQKESEAKINYWGFKRGYYYAPKSGYAHAENASAEFKDMVKALHKADIEVLMQFYFPPQEKSGEIADILRFWVDEYHVDGFRLLGTRLPAASLATDPLLAGTKLIAGDFPLHEIYGEREAVSCRSLGIVRESFLYDMRRALKGDEGCMQDVTSHLLDNADKTGVINAITGYDGFTLRDLVSYDRKHNEANGEDNQDGTDYNLSWNCGAEGKTRKKSVIALRVRQMRNALALLFLSQGTPYLRSGDEFGQTQGGNNNPYCQDNEVTWLDWKNVRLNREFYEYTKALIAFRMSHAVFHREQRVKGMDTLGYGCPDVSFHGEEAWKPSLEPFSRSVGVLYCGRYAMNDGRTQDDDFYMAVNMHWEPHEFALPKLSKHKTWRLVMDTALPGAFVPAETQEETADDGDGSASEAFETATGVTLTAERSIQVYVAQSAESGKSK